MVMVLNDYIKKLEQLDYEKLYNNDFLLTWEKTGDELDAVFAVADALRRLRENNISARIFDSGLGVSIFRDFSTRTRFSFASACNMLGLEVQDLDEGKSQIAHGETVRETANMISFMADVIGIRDYTMMLVMLDCGIRSGELLQLLPRHFDVERATIHVVDSIAKTRVERILNISSPTVNAIRKVMSARHPLWGDNVPIFCSRDGREMTSSTWGHEFKKYVRRKNLDDAISPYDLRHTFAIMFLRNGGNLFALKTIMGHEQLEMTERYARFVGQDVKREHEKASPVRQLMSKRVR
jgi:integrase